MSVITISSGEIEHYQGADSVLKLRIFVRRNFTTSDGEAIVNGMLDSDLFYREVPCTVLDGVVTYDEFALDSTEDGSPNNSYYIFALYNMAGERQGDPVYKRIIVPASPTNRTLGELAVYSGLPVVQLAANYYQAIINYIDNQIAGLVNMATKATTSLFGAVKISFAPAVSGQPVAVSNNDPIVRATRKTVYLETYGHTQSGLTALITAMGDGVTPIELKVTSQVAVTANTSIPVNMLVTLEGDGSFTVDAGHTLTIGSMDAPPPRQVFFGAGNVVFAKNAVTHFHLSWWAGISNTGDCTHSFDQVHTSLGTNAGGLFLIGPGTWKTTNFNSVNCMIMQGAGSDVNGGGRGTQIQLFDTTTAGGAVLKIQEAFRNLVFSDITFSAGNSTNCHAVLFSGSAPNSGVGAQFNNCTFHGTGVGAPGQVKMWDADGAHAWECIDVHFNHCQWQTPVNGKSFHVDTVNSSYLFTSPQVNNAIGSVFFYGEYTGWPEIDGVPDFRGVNASPYVTSASNRVIAGSIASGSHTLVLTTGQWALDDISQQVVIAGKLNANITDIDPDGVTATVSNAASGTATAEALTVYRYTPSTQMAKAVFWLINSRNEILVNNWTDEGYQYSIINDGSDLTPFTINGGKVQSRMKLNQAMCLNLTGGVTVFSNSIETAVSILSHVIADKCNVRTASINGATLVSPRLLGPQNGGVTVLGWENNANEYEHRSSKPVLFKRGNEYNNILTASRILSIAAVDDAMNPNRPLGFFGRLNPTTEKPDHGYLFWRDNTTGWFTWQGTQSEPNNGFKHNGRVQATTYIGGVIRPAAIAADQNNYFPGDSSEHYRLTTSGTYKLTGLALTGTPRDGERHKIWNDGANLLGIDHENAASVAGNRFKNNTAAIIWLLPGESALLEYDTTAARWLVSRVDGDPQPAYIAADVTYNNVAALADTALGFAVKIGGKYAVELRVFSTSAAKALNMDFAGTATIANFIGRWEAFKTDDPATGDSARVAAAGTDFTVAALDGVDSDWVFRGSFEVSAAGTFLLRGAQNSANASATMILRGSCLIPKRLN